MAKPIITLNGLKMVIILGMLAIILTGIRFAADITAPFILASFLAVIINLLVQLLVRCRVPRVLAISMPIGLTVMLAIVLLTSLGASLNELVRTLLQYRNYLYEPMQTIVPWLQRMGLTVSVVELNKYIDPNAVMTLATSLLTQLLNVMSSIFLLLLTMVFMLLKVPQPPAKLQQLTSRPVEGMGVIQWVIDSMSCYLVLKTAVSLATGLMIWDVLVLLGVRFVFMWGLLASALSYIPNIGSMPAAIPPILQVLVSGGLYEVLVVLTGYLIVNLVLGNILGLRVTGCGLGLSTLVVSLSLIFWGWLPGPVGMLLSVPLAIIAKIALEQTSGGQSIAFLLSDVSKE